jgi:hypothetical protein
MAIDCIAEIPGAAELSNWFSGFPSFHDANAALQINGDGSGWLKAFGFRMTSEIDAKGNLVCDRHFSATFHFDGLRSVSLSDFMPGPIILYSLDVRKTEEGFRVGFEDTSYGVAGAIVTERLRVDFVPDERWVSAAKA